MAYVTALSGKFFVTINQSREMVNTGGGVAGSGTAVSVRFDHSVNDSMYAFMEAM